ncbi:MAG: hypothetical protein ACJAYE_003157 [Candidatus Azotimanducaceae bacterium]|jgi:hypothetical protein
MYLLDNFRYPTKQAPTPIVCFQIFKERLEHVSELRSPHWMFFSAVLLAALLLKDPGRESFFAALLLS